MFSMKKITARPDATEKQAVDRLIAAAEKIARDATWCNLSRSRVVELRVPLAELKRARRKQSNNGGQRSA